MNVPRRIAVGAVFASLLCICRGGHTLVNAPESWSAWNIGRFILQLPDSSTLTTQTQVLDGITVTLESASSIPLKVQLSERVADLTKDHRSPMVDEYLWSGSMGAVLHVMDISDPTYYQMEGRRLLPQHVVVATTDGDKSKVDVMQAIIQEILNNYASS